MTNPFLFVLTVVTILVMPGPTNTLLATGGATVGMRRALPLALAERWVTASPFWRSACSLKPILEQWPRLAQVLRVMVSVYLFFLASMLLRDAKRKFGVEPDFGARLPRTRL